MESQFLLTEKDYRYLFENASDAIWIHDVEGRLLDANQAFGRLSGYTIPAYLGFDLTVSLSREAMALARDVRRKLLKGEQIKQPYEQSFIRRDGSKRIYMMSTSPVIIDGKVRGFQNLARDVTEEKRAEQLLIKITNGSPIPSFVINKEHTVTHWNLALEALTGITAREIIGTQDQWRAFYKRRTVVMADMVVDGASAAAIQAQYPGDCKQSPLIEGAYEADAFFSDLGASGKWLRLTASPVKDEKGEFIGAIETLQDITEEKQLQENMRFYVQRIIRAREEERKSISRELHDDASSNLLLLIQRLDAIASDTKHKLALPLKKSIDELHGQSVAVLDSIRRCAQDLRPRILDDLGLVAAIEWMAEDMVKKHGIDTRVKILGSEQSLPVETQLLLFRIVQEALNNIRRHAKASVSSVKLEFGNETITVVVTDNGRGFKVPDKMENLAHTGRLGVLGMYERALLLHGTTEIKSGPEQGTQVTVRIPRFAAPPGE